MKGDGNYLVLHPKAPEGAFRHLPLVEIGWGYEGLPSSLNAKRSLLATVVARVPCGASKYARATRVLGGDIFCDGSSQGSIDRSARGIL